mmetsp:Transcript_77327/g.202924  ORF Transcript_77327/g.202924 Transcript_77327/m.202924 type:complete len:202 (+) Transcript_77327:367-972(+)
MVLFRSWYVHTVTVLSTTTPALKEYLYPSFRTKGLLGATPSLEYLVSGLPRSSVRIAATTALLPGVLSSSSTLNLAQMSLSRYSTCVTPIGRKIQSTMKRIWFARLKMRCGLKGFSGCPLSIRYASVSTVGWKTWFHVLACRLMTYNTPCLSMRVVLGVQPFADLSWGSASTSLHLASIAKPSPSKVLHVICEFSSIVTTA